MDILLTHHHFDHVGGTLELKKQINGKVYGPAGNIEGIDIHVTENDDSQNTGLRIFCARNSRSYA